MGRARVVVLSVLALVLVVVLPACNNASSVAPDELIVTVDGLPGGVSGDVLVTGPGAFSQALTATATLSSLTPGTYTVTVSATSDGDAIVPTMYDGTASLSLVAVTDSAGGSTTVRYAVRPGSGHLWVPRWGGSFEAESFSSGNLTTSGSPSQDVTLTSSTHSGEAVAFDHAGNMWVTDYGGYVYRYDAAQLANSGSPDPGLTISANATPSLSNPYGLAFDASGDLWVANNGNNTVVEFTPSQLSTSGSPTPNVTLSADAGTPNSLKGPNGIAFDASGDLWVANSGNSTVVEFTPSQLSTTGGPTPKVTLGATSGSIAGPGGIAFDANGNLWVPNDGSDTVVRFDAVQLATSGSPIPATTIASSSAGPGPDGLTFDASGALWVGNYNGPSSGYVRRFTNPDNLKGGVTPIPDVIISSIGTVDWVHLAFSPPASGLPINAP